MTFTTRRIRSERGRRRFPWTATFVLLLRYGHPAVRWIREAVLRVQAKHKAAWRRMLLQRTAVILGAVLLVLFLFTGLVRAVLSLHTVGLRTVLSVAGSDLPRDEHGFTNLLLLGQGDVSHDGRDLTDTVMIASIDPKTRSIILLSLPRDLYFLRTAKMGKGRLNSLYRDMKGFLRSRGMETEEASLEAMQELRREIGDTLGLTIHHVLKVDFEGFEQAIDALDGVDLEVPYDIVDTEYPGPDYSYETFTIPSGPQHLDGATALKYVRSRHTTSDFDRAARQQQLLQALGDKVKREGTLRSPANIAALLKIIGEHLETTMTMRELAGLTRLGLTPERDRVITMQLSDRNGLFGDFVEPGGFLYAPPRDQFEGASVLLPISIPEFPVTWKQVKTLSAVLFRNRAIALERPTVHVLNAGAKSGIGRKLGNELIRYGFEVSTIANASSLGKLPESFVFAGTEAKQTSSLFFSSLLRLPLRTIPVGLPPEEMGDVTILLGKNYTYTPLQDLIPSSLLP